MNIPPSQGFPVAVFKDYKEHSQDLAGLGLDRKGSKKYMFRGGETLYILYTIPLHKNSICTQKLKFSLEASF